MRTDIETMYYSFVVQRHAIWEKRQAGIRGPWTGNPFMWKKYTNVFRVLDPGSQYVVRMMNESWSDSDALARAFLYRYTNRPETWDYMRRQLGHWPRAEDMDDHLFRILEEYRENGGQIFSGAYIIMPAPNTRGDKAAHAVALAHRLMHPESPHNVLEQVLGAATPRAAFDALKAHNGVGDFMAMQVLTDWGYYSKTWDENEFVIAGPGSKKGVAFLETGLTAEEVIRQTRDEWLFRVDQPLIDLPNGNARPLSLMDVQNTFCEFSKYMRNVKGEMVPKLPYRPAHPGPQPEPTLPAHWL